MPRTAQLLVSCLLLGSTAAFNSPFNRFNKRSVRRVNKFPGKGKGGGFFGGNNMGGGGNNKGPGPLDSSAADGGGSGGDGDEGGLWASYNKALETDPLVTKAMTSLIGFLIGDILAQKFIDKNEKYDYYRTFKLASFGALIHGPTGHWFYGKLDGAISGTSVIPVFTKVGIDQVLWNPIFGVMFFGYMGILEGKNVSQTVQKIKNDLMTQVTGSWKVWPFAHAINFAFIPTEQRLLYINTIQIGYNMFLSVISNRDAAEAK